MKTYFKYDLSIILPRYNENYSIISKSLNRLSGLRKLLDVQIIVINDGGNLNDFNLAKKNFTDIIFVDNEKNQGKGYSIKRGMSIAEGRFICFSDIDLPVNLKSILECFKVLKNSPETNLILGSRYASRSKIVGNSNFYRKVTSKSFIKLFNFLLVPKVNDSQCPLKIFTYQAGKKLFGLNHLKGYAFDAEIIYLSKLLGYKNKQLPIEWKDTRAEWNFFKTFQVYSKMIRDLVYIRLYWMFNRAKLSKTLQVTTALTTSKRVA